MGQKHILTVPGRYKQIRNICRFVCTGAENAGLDEKAIFHIELACDEASTNIIEHAYGAEDKGDITISYEIEEDDFIITFQDNGRSFDPQNIPPPAIPSNSPPDEVAMNTLKAGGLGLHFMRKLMDTITFYSDQQQGNTLIMIKKIGSKGTK